MPMPLTFLLTLASVVTSQPRDRGPTVATSAPALYRLGDEEARAHSTDTPLVHAVLFLHVAERPSILEFHLSGQNSLEMSYPHSSATASPITDPLPMFARPVQTYDPFAQLSSCSRSPSVFRHPSPRRARHTRTQPPLRAEASRLGLFATGASTPPCPHTPSTKKCGDAPWGLLRDRLQALADACLLSPSRTSAPPAPQQQQLSSLEDSGAASAYLRFGSSGQVQENTFFRPWCDDSSTAPSELWTEIDLGFPARDEASLSPFSILPPFPLLSPPIMSSSHPDSGPQVRIPAIPSRRPSLVDDDHAMVVEHGESDGEDVLGLRVATRNSKAGRRRWPDATMPGSSYSPSYATLTPSCLSERLQRLAPPPLLLPPPLSLASDSGVVLDSHSPTTSNAAPHASHPVTALYFPPSSSSRFSGHSSSAGDGQLEGCTQDRNQQDQLQGSSRPSPVAVRSSRRASYGPASPASQLAEDMQGLGLGLEGLYVARSPPPLRRIGMLPLPSVSPSPAQGYYAGMQPLHELMFAPSTASEDLEASPLPSEVEMEAVPSGSGFGDIHNPLIFDRQHGDMLSPLDIRFGFSGRMNDLEGRTASCIEAVEWIRLVSIFSFFFSRRGL